jgi:ferrochelatase
VHLMSTSYSLSLMKTGLLLVNTGSPSSPTPRAVFSYLMQFLLDPRVIDVPAVLRHLLVGGVIVPFRYRKSARSYASIWTQEGSPLIANAKKLRDALRESLGENFIVETCMRYGAPSIKEALSLFEKEKLQKIIILPLFPQYASATSGSVIEEAFCCIKKWQSIPHIVSISDFVYTPGFLQSWVDVAKPYDFSSYDHILFSFHGLPKRHLKKTCFSCEYNCGRCYPNQCLYLTQALVQALQLDKEKTSICFQSRLGVDEWLEPYTQEVIKKLARQGAKRLCIFAPSFVADCLETLYELGIEYRDEFLQLGGTHLDLIPSLNAHPTWVSTIKTIVDSFHLPKARLTK